MSRAKQNVLFVCAALCVIAGAALIMSSAMSILPAPSSSSPTPAPTAGEPAWTHTCLGTDDEPPGCP